MRAKMSRFQVISDPLNQWVIWDREQDLPACFGGQRMLRLSEGYARRIASLMNEIYGSAPLPAR